MSQNLRRILPDCNLPATSFRDIVVLQQARFSLLEAAPHIEQEKHRLRETFIRFGLEVTSRLRKQQFFADVIDPRSGYPLLSRSGETIHNDTAAVKALLGFPVITNRCSVLVHPGWGTAVYPGILLTSAASQVITPALRSAAYQQGWRTPAIQLD